VNRLDGCQTRQRPTGADPTMTDHHPRTPDPTQTRTGSARQTAPPAGPDATTPSTTDTVPGVRADVAAGAHPGRATGHRPDTGPARRARQAGGRPHRPHTDPGPDVDLPGRTPPIPTSSVRTPPGTDRSAADGNRTARSKARQSGSPAPIPVSVWPVGPSHTTCTTPGCTATVPGRPVAGPPCAGRLPDRLWYRMVAAFSRPGDLVLVADAGTGAAVAACADFDRRVIARAATRTTRTRIRALSALTARTGTTGEGVTVFGDAPRRRTGRLAVTWPAHTHRRPASLLLVPTPCTQDRDGQYRGPAGDQWQRQVIADAVHLLHPGALIVAVTASSCATSTSDARGFDDPTGRIITAAQALGLTYLQHIVAITAHLVDGHLTLADPTATRTPAPDHPTHAATVHNGAAQRRHRRTHLDLIVLAVPGGPRDV
jgi:hypothetical protein